MDRNSVTLDTEVMGETVMRKPNRWQRYVIAVGITALATAVRVALDPVLGDSVPFVTFFPALLFTGWICGFGPTLLALPLSALIVDFFFLTPRGSLLLGHTHDQVGMLFYLVSGIATALLSRSLHSTHRQIQEQVEKLLATESALRQETRLMDSVIQNMRGGLALADQDGRLIVANSSLERILGRAVEGSSREQAAEMFEGFRELGPSPKLLDHNPLAKALLGETIDDGEFGFQPSSMSEERIVSVTACPIQDEGGDIQGAVVLVRDITEKKRAEEALQESLLFLHETERIARIGGWKANLEADTLTWTEGVHHIIEEPLDTRVVLTEGLRFFVPECIPLLRKSLKQTLEDGTPFSLETEGVTATGKRLWVEVRGAKRIGEGENRYVVGTIQDITQRRQAEAELKGYAFLLRRFTHRVVNGQEAERRHLARELHDEIGQLLTLVKLTLSKDHSSEDRPATVESFQAALTLVDQTIDKVRSLSSGLRPPLLDELGLIPALRSLISRTEKVAQFAITFGHDPSIERFDTEAELACFRIVQESLTNISRHASARNVSIELSRTDSAITLTITDDGVGFDVDQVRGRSSEDTGLGLVGMTERALLLGGCVEIESGSGRGTRISASVPFHRSPVASQRLKLAE